MTIFKKAINRMSLLQVVYFIVGSFSIFVRALNQDSAITINMESFEEIITKRISRLDSKVDSILATCGNNPNHQATVDAEANHKICSISLRMIEMENVIAALKSSSTTSPFGDRPVAPSFDALSKLESKFENIQDWIAKEDSRIKMLEQRIQEISTSATVSSPSANSEVELGNQNCIGKGLASHLMRINTNIFFRKFANASTTHDDNAKYAPMSAFDGEIKTFYHSKKESNPWMVVDLGSPHFIIEVRVIIRDTNRVSNIKLFSSNNATFFRDGGVTTDLAQDFGAQMLSADVKTVVFRSEDAACARYLLLTRAIQNEYLIVVEMQGIGYPLPKA